MKALVLFAAVFGSMGVGCGGVSPGRTVDGGLDRIEVKVEPDASQDGGDLNSGDGSRIDGGLDGADAPRALPSVESFTATPTLLPASGGMVRLQWTVRDATSLSITGVGPVTGDSVTVSVLSSQTFALTAFNPDGADTKVARVEVDAVLPTVTTFLPANNATGVAADTNVVVTFSEPMNRVKTQAAYTSTDIPSGFVAFSWNDAGTVLTINPANDLAYAEGNGADVRARAYALSFLDVAEDLAGNKLAPAPLTFQTLRKLTLKMRRLSSLDGWADGGAAVLSADGTNIWIGDTAADVATRGFLGYDIAPLPGGLISIDRAEAFAYQMTVVGAPYATLGGSIAAEHVTFPTLDAAAFSSAALRTVGVFSADVTPGWKKADVTSAVREDFMRRDTRGGRSQYRLSFATPTNSNGAVDRVELYDSPDAFEPYLNVTIITP